MLVTFRRTAALCRQRTLQNVALLCGVIFQFVSANNCPYFRTANRLSSNTNNQRVVCEGDTFCDCSLVLQTSNMCEFHVNDVELLTQSFTKCGIAMRTKGLLRGPFVFALPIEIFTKIARFYQNLKKPRFVCDCCVFCEGRIALNRPHSRECHVQVHKTPHPQHHKCGTAMRTKCLMCGPRAFTKSLKIY